MKHLIRFIVITTIMHCSPILHAHFIWVLQTGNNVQLHFSEGPEAPEPELLNNIQSAKVCAKVAGSRGEAKFVEIPLTLAADSLSGKVVDKASAIVVAHEYGVVSNGDAPFLLKYFAKQNTSPLPGQWDAVNNSEYLPLEITPRLVADKLNIKVTLKGSTAEGLEVVVAGCGVEETLTTNKDGIVTCQPKSDGIITARVKHVENTAGELHGKKYDSVRTYSTITLPFSVPQAKHLTQAVAELSTPVTSFGAAIVGDDIYVYGGHFGDAHHYSDSGQSGEFSRISLTKENAQWEPLPGGPKLTGLALVEHGGKLYRVGGFTAKNTDDQDQNLWSQNSFACCDPATGAWTDLPPMPSGRSSHDAAVLDGKLYVVGGWNMEGPEKTTWHKSALMCDLTRPELKWTEIATPPFQRRAISLAAWDGKLYVVGGMQEDNQISSRVDVFDPASNAWSAAPEILGTGMEGFGTSAFAVEDQLVVTTMSGSIQGLRKDHSEWNVIGQMQAPRFFHRQLTTRSGQILLIAGASMETGKTGSVELLQLTSP